MANKDGTVKSKASWGFHTWDGVAQVMKDGQIPLTAYNGIWPSFMTCATPSQAWNPQEAFDFTVPSLFAIIRS
eukprot:180622-Prorocentrum_minimum.AAC.1